MQRLKSRLSSILVRGEEGASFSEYGLMLAVVVLAVGVAASALRDDLAGLLSDLGAEVVGATAPDVP